MSLVGARALIGLSAGVAALVLIGAAVRFAAPREAPRSLMKA